MSLRIWLLKTTCKIVDTQDLLDVSKNLILLLLTIYVCFFCDHSILTVEIMKNFDQFQVSPKSFTDIYLNDNLEKCLTSIRDEFFEIVGVEKVFKSSDDTTKFVFW